MIKIGNPYEQEVWERWEVKRRYWAVQLFYPHIFDIAAIGCTTEAEIEASIVRLLHITVVQFDTFDETDLRSLHHLAWSAGLYTLEPCNWN